MTLIKCNCYACDICELRSWLLRTHFRGIVFGHLGDKLGPKTILLLTVVLIGRFGLHLFQQFLSEFFVTQVPAPTDTLPFLGRVFDAPSLTVLTDSYPYTAPGVSYSFFFVGGNG